MSTQAVAYWHYHQTDGAVTLPGKTRGKALSYYQLVEVAFVASFRRLGVSLTKLRSAHAFWSQQLNSEFPFAEYRFRTDGAGLLFELQQVEPDTDLSAIAIMDRAGQVGWAHILETRFLEFSYEHGLALRWHPAGPVSPVIIDPRVSFGAPTVGGVATWAIKGRHAAGETDAEIAEDFGLKVDLVNDALRFEGVLTRAA